MKKYTLLLVSTLMLCSCYTYKVYEPDANQDEVKQANNSPISLRENSVRTARQAKDASTQNIEKNNDVSKNVSAKGDNNKKNESVSTENITVKSIIKDKGYYQVEVFDQTYKLEAVKWQGDTLLAHIKGKPKKELKFHEKDIQNLKVRQFSKGRSDALTVAAYATAGVGVFLLLK